MMMSKSEAPLCPLEAKSAARTRAEVMLPSLPLPLPLDLVFLRFLLPDVCLLLELADASGSDPELDSAPREPIMSGSRLSCLGFGLEPDRLLPESLIGARLNTPWLKVGLGGSSGLLGTVLMSSVLS